MRRFFTVLFFGLALVFAGIALVWGVSQGWSSKSPVNSDGTMSDGLSKIIRYTANEEEDVINSALGSIPKNGRDGITASAYLVKNLTKNSIWTGYNPDRLLPMASLAKLVTAVIAKHAVAADTEIEITPQIITTIGNTAGFRAGETFTSSDLIYPLLMVSSNDAAEAYARKLGRKGFIKSMNDFAQSVGAYRTYFSDPSGLSKYDVSTANDLAIIMEWIAKNDPDLIEVTALKSKTIRNHTWINPTHFLSWSYYVGGKNGYTPEAGRTSASLFKLGYDKDLYAVVVLGSDNRDADVVRLINKVK